jgi:hypothetical protein
MPPPQLGQVWHRPCARNVSHRGFDLCIRTWDDIKVLAIEVGWLAHGK